MTYQDIELNAGYIIFSFETNVVTARGIIDSTGQLVQNPISSGQSAIHVTGDAL
ncbi:MAG: hypothetical protein IPJ06_04730 [Saprospiraceae bacterium]|nr:hypothetical protein [Saprospiraceae bacterium]